MTKIALLFAGNAWHADVTSAAALRDMWVKMYGIPHMIGVPWNASFQRIDFELLPWLQAALASNKWAHVISASYSHAILPLLHPAQQVWECEHRVNPDSRITFFGEFVTPESRYVPSPATLILGPSTFAYHPQGVWSGGWVSDPGDHNLIRYGNTDGIVIRGFESIRSAFFQFQRHPLGENRDGISFLKLLMTSIREVIERNEYPLVVLPMDIEAPWVGSLVGEDIWRLFFKALTESGLGKRFITLEDAYEMIKNKPYLSPLPDRELGPKWTNFRCQLERIFELMTIRPNDERGHTLLSLAGGSDGLSGVGRTVANAKPTRRVNFSPLYDLDGRAGALSIESNPQLLRMFAALKDAVVRGENLSSLIEATCDLSHPLVAALHRWNGDHSRKF